MLHIEPSPALAPFIERLWYSDGRESNECSRSTRELSLPTGSAHLALRLSNDPIRVFDSIADEHGSTFGHAVVGGVRSRYFVRDTAQPSISLGVQFRAGGAAAFLGMPADELSHRHTRLEELWGKRSVSELRERLLAASSPTERIACFMAELAERSTRSRAIHPAIACALAELNRPCSPAAVDKAWRASGFSRRHFIELFRREVGLTPKVYARIRRFQGVLDQARRPTRPAWTRLALDHGFFDQSHLVREFQAFAGLAPSAYKPSSSERFNHVPVLAAEFSKRSIPSKPARAVGS
jgi:AraC-like DNA-binding protein